MNPKREAQLCHSIAVLSFLLAGKIYDLDREAKNAVKIKNISQELLPITEELIEEVYKIPEISRGIYLIELSNKFDTLIRKNFEQITNETIIDEE